MSKEKLLALEKEFTEVLAPSAQRLNSEAGSLEFEIPESVRRKVDALIATQSYSNEVAFNNARINYLCLYALMDFLAGEPDLHSKQLTIFPGEAELVELLECFNGIKIALDGRQLVLLPMEVDELEVLEIPQEWVDIADFAAEYYIAVQVDSENGWLAFVGGASYQTIKQQGICDLGLRAYHLAAENLLGFNSILVAGPVAKPHIQSLPALLPERVQCLLAQLGKQTFCSPRFLVPFPQYGALIAAPELRTQLYRRRTQTLPVNVSLWLEDKVDAIARALCWELVPLPTTAMALRSGTTSELEWILNSLERESEIVVPSKAKCVSIPGEESIGVPQIYTIIWPTQDTVPEEWMLLVVLKAMSGRSLPVGTKLQIRDETQLLVDYAVTLEQSYRQPPDD
ncbi:MAG: DUF1822 family protein, partial [Cyanobacteria bacterium J06641_5]